MTPTHLAAVLGRIPSGLFILTARRGDDETGMLASWIMQAGFDPPMITVALHAERLLARWLTAGSPFTVNLLAEEQRPLLAHFARGFDEGELAFAGLEIRRTAAGVPVLPGTIGYLECEPTGHIDSGDHRIFLARIAAGHLFNGQDPIVHIRKNGLRY